MAPLPLKALISGKNARVLECLQPSGAREFLSAMSALIVARAISGSLERHRANRLERHPSALALLVSTTLLPRQP